MARSLPIPSSSPNQMVIVKRSRFEYVLRLNDRFVGATSTLRGARRLARKAVR